MPAVKNVTFNVLDIADNLRPKTLIWSFGDESNSSVYNPNIVSTEDVTAEVSHTYTKSGMYTVELIIKDTSNRLFNIVKSFKVPNKPPAPIITCPDSATRGSSFNIKITVDPEKLMEGESITSVYIKVNDDTPFEGHLDNNIQIDVPEDYPDNSMTITAYIKNNLDSVSSDTIVNIPIVEEPI